MPIIDPVEAQSQLDAWLEASKALANGKTYQIGDRILTLSESAHVLEMINYWGRIVQSGGMRKGPTLGRATYR